MKKIKVLIVEDDPQKLSPILTRLNSSIFEKEVRNTLHDAIDLVVTSGARFEVFLVDLQLTKEEQGKEPFYEGIALAAELRAAAPDAVIILYSGSIMRGSEKSFLYHEECMRHADAAYSRSELFSKAGQQLTDRIIELLEIRRKINIPNDITFDDGIRTKAVCEIFGASTLQSLVAALLKVKGKFVIKALQAGYSGAAILKVEGRATEFGGSVNLIVKVSNSHESLSDEISRLPMLGSVLDRFAVIPGRQEPVERQGVFAIALREVREMQLLRDYLLQDNSLRAQKTILNRVVKDLLVAPASEALQWNSLGCQDSGFKFRAVAASQTSDFLDGISEFENVLNADHLKAVHSVRGFIDAVLTGAWSFPVQGRLAALLHGDFHCRNIFVSREEAPAIIDFGRSEIYPRLFDFAALDVDLIASVLDSGRGRDHEIGLINEWRDIVFCEFPFNDGKRPQGTTGAIHYLRGELLAQVRQMQPKVLPLEYAESLMFNYLRYLRFPTVTFPKKVLAVCIINDLIQKFGLS